MDKIEHKQLFTVLSQHGGLWALEQVELLKRLRREPNNHKALVKAHREVEE